MCIDTHIYMHPPQFYVIYTYLLHSCSSPFFLCVTFTVFILTQENTINPWIQFIAIPSLSKIRSPTVGILPHDFHFVVSYDLVQGSQEAKHHLTAMIISKLLCQNWV